MAKTGSLGVKIHHNRIQAGWVGQNKRVVDDVSVLIRKRTPSPS